MKVSVLIFSCIFSSLSFADEFVQNEKFLCDEHLIEVSTYCGCLSGLSPEAMDSASSSNCSVNVKIMKENKEILPKEISIKGCAQAYEYEDRELHYLCVANESSKNNAVSYFSNTLTDYPWRKKCILNSRD